MIAAGSGLMLHYPLNHLCHLVVAESYLAEDSLSLVGSETVEVFLAWSNTQSSHVEGTGTNEILCLALSRIAVGTMFLAREDHREITVGNTP